VLGLSLVQSAYTAEIIRGGILGVEHGQHEAAAALGLPAYRRTFRIILPQALRSILPTGFNEVISLAKGTSIVYVLSMPELFYTVQVIYNRTQQVIPLLMVATVWYLLITTVLSVLQYYVERYFSRGTVRQVAPTPLQRLRQWRLPVHNGSLSGESSCPKPLICSLTARRKLLLSSCSPINLIPPPSGASRSTISANIMARIRRWIMSA
jgi:ABC-type Fe3+ transport system permease subunit